jgi:glycosyltransferase involved in cell wall biosynthesis
MVLPPQPGQSTLNAPNALLPRESAPGFPDAGGPPEDARRASGADEDARHAQGAELRIGIDARAAAEVPAGRGRVVRELLRALAEREDDGARYTLYAREPWAPEVLDERFVWHTIDARDPWWHLRAARLANRECDVFLSSNSYLTGRFLRIPCVPIVYDLVTFDRAMQPNRRSQLIERLTLGSAVRRSAALIAISRATADALADHFPRAAPRTVVAPLGVAPALGTAPELDTAREPSGPGPTDRAAPKPSGPEPTDRVAPARGGRPIAATGAADTATLPAPGFVLAAGTLEPRKNLPRLVEAYRRLPDALRTAHPLVVVGALGWETGPTLRALDSLNGQAIRLGYVSDEELAELYRRCSVFCYPSLGEGFGLPVLEAMATGAAVLTSGLSSLPEVGGDAVAYANPHDVDSIASELERLLGDDATRAELGRRASARASEFSWERFADSVLATLKGAAKGVAAELPRTAVETPAPAERLSGARP